MALQSLMHVRTGRDGVISRRTFMRDAALISGLGLLGWKDALTLHAGELRKRGMACILLFMRGGPSQLETFDPKPGTINGGPTKAISTAVSGIQVAEGWSNLAKEMKDIALIRSMTNREGEHVRASYQLHTGYAPTGSVKFPTLGSIVASEIAPSDFDLPHFVSIGNRLDTIGSGFLGMNVAPFLVADPSKVPNNVSLPRGVSTNRFSRQTGTASAAGAGFRRGRRRGACPGPSRPLWQRVSDGSEPAIEGVRRRQEKDSVRDRYGRSPFGQGCLLARRLIETGVTFVEVASNGWDTHDDNFNRVKKLSDAVDPGFAALVSDLKERGMLDKTLVIWMGEFGRTPKINPRTGRDHFPKAFNVALAGGGVKGGQVIGATSPDGMTVTNRPVSVPDLFCSFYQVLKINPRKENMSTLGRPIKIVDGGKPVTELFA